MQGELSLEAIAEVAIALAGFSGLVAMVRSGPVYDWHPRVRLAFWVSLSWSIATLVLSALPSILAPLGLASWPLLNVIAGLVLLLGISLMLAAHVALNRRGQPTHNPWHWTANILIVAVGSTGTLGSALGFLGGASHEWYRFGVLFCLMSALPGFLASFRIRAGAPAV